MSLDLSSLFSGSNSVQPQPQNGLAGLLALLAGRPSQAPGGQIGLLGQNPQQQQLQAAGNQLSMGQQLMGQAGPRALPAGASAMAMGGGGMGGMGGMGGGMGGGMRNPAPAMTLPNTPGLATSPGIQNTPFLAQLLQRLGGQG